MSVFLRVMLLVFSSLHKDLRSDADEEFTGGTAGEQKTSKCYLQCFGET